MKTNKLFFTLIFFQLLCLALHAQQNPQPHFRNYSTEHGLPSHEVHFIFEDSRGYMWFGTDNGAARFDGYEFKIYGAQEGLMSNVVFDIHEDVKGRIWFGTMTAEAFILENDTIVPYAYNHIVKEFEGKFRGGTLAHVAEDETTYFELNEFGVLKIDSSGNYETIVGKELTSMLIVKEEGMERNIAVPSSKKKNPDIFKYQEELDEKNIYNIDVVNNNKRFQKSLNRLNKDGRSGHGRISTSGELLVQIGGYLHCLVDTQLIWSVPFNFAINDIVFEKGGPIWFCLDSDIGVRRYANLDALKNNQYDTFLKGLSATRMLIDSKNKYWFATLEEGVFYMSDFELLIYNSKQGLSNDFIKSVTFQNDINLFVGCENGEIFEINLKTNQINKFGTTRYAMNNSMFFFRSIIYDKVNEKLWGGAFYFKNGEKHYIKYPHPNNKDLIIFLTSSLDNLQINSKRQLIGTRGFSGFYIIDLAKESMLFQSAGTKIEKRVYGFFSDHADNLWIGNRNGIFQFKDSTLVHSGINHPAFHNRVEDIDELPNNTLTFGTKGYGVILWKGDSILQITNDDGLTSNMLEDVHVDDNGILWAGTLNGLNKITFDEKGKPIVRTFTTFNGLPSNEINQVESYEGQVWLCTSGGLVKFHEAPENKIAPPPIIQWAKINNEETDWNSNANANTFSYQENNFEFRFLTINYRMNGRIPYRYRLDKNTDWQYTQNLTVNYPSLVPNDYTFEVQAQNEDGYWSKSTTYEFTIQPPWWATRWFRTLSVLTIGWLGYSFYKYRTDQIRRESDLKNQMTDLEKSALQAQMNPHFIFNSLNSIQNFILKNDTKKAVEYLSRFARLVRHNLNASVQGVITLEEEISILDNYLALERERFEQRFEYKIIVDPEIEKSFIEFPPMLIQPYVENAVVHGISKKEGQGFIKVEFRKDNENLLVTIQDNGIGYRQGQDGTKSKRHKSVGMTITQKRLELLGNADDAVQIKTLTNKHNEQQGTQVQILIKTK